MNIKMAENFLFTGAGFTKDFGGFLATEMWTEIFNHPEVRKHARLRELLLNDFDYESIYYRVLKSSEYSSGEKEAIKKAVLKAYNSLDANIANCSLGTYGPDLACISGVNKMIKCCAGGQNKIPFFFTINQDLFVERFTSDIGKKVIYPFFKDNWILPTDRRSSFPNDITKPEWVTVPDQNEIQKKTGNPLSCRFLYYVKLHGSYGWKSSDGSDLMVIGRSKEQQIAQEPLLTAYFDFFRNVLSQGVKLLVIGYGFGDEHVNRVIAESIKDYGLEVYVLSPTDPESFITDLKKEKYTYGKVILSGLKCYFPHELAKVFPADQSETQAWEEIRNCYFGNN